MYDPEFTNSYSHRVVRHPAIIIIIDYIFYLLVQVSSNYPELSIFVDSLLNFAYLCYIVFKLLISMIYQYSILMPNKKFNVCLKLFPGLLIMVCRFLEFRVVGVLFYQRDNVIQLDDFLGSTFSCYCRQDPQE